MAGSCSGGGAVTSRSWRRNATSAWSTAPAPTDNLPANTGSAPVTYTYGLTACAGTACANEVVTTFTVAGTPVAGSCSLYPNVVIMDFPLSGTVDTTANGGFAADGIFVGRMTIPANVNPAGVGQVRFVEFVDGEAARQMTVSSQPCDFRGFVVASVSATDPTGTNYPIRWSNSQTPSISYQSTGPSANAVLQAGQTYYFNVRNVDWASGLASCQTASCNGRFQIAAP